MSNSYLSIKKLLLLNFFLLGAGLSSQSLAQTNTTYTYDALGRVITVIDTAGKDIGFTYDEVNNITSEVSIAGGTNGGNNSPTCTTYNVVTSYSGGGWSGTVNCSDSDGDPLTVTAVTDPPGSTTADISNNYIIVNNLQCGSNSMTRTVSDGNGGTVNSSFVVTRTYHPWYAPGC